MVLPGGEIVTIGGKSGAQGGLDLLGLVTGSEGLLGVVVEVVVKILRKAPENSGYDLMGIITGSEGLLGVVTEVTVRILKKPDMARALLVGFPSSEEAGQCVADIIAAGIIPGGMEMMDRPAIRAAEDFVHAGYPLDVEALLIVELDGCGAELDHLIGRVEEIALKNGSVTCRISPDYYCMDGTIPRKELPRVLHGMRQLSEQYGLRVANVFHAGDGNLHPLILYDANIPGELDKAEAFGADILKLCVKVGGVLTGEHGVGVEKRDLMGEMFNQTDLDQQMRVKCAFDPGHLLNPGKVFPQLRRCAELGRMHIHRGQMPFPDIPRF
jgi:glycolate oxidase